MSEWEGAPRLGKALAALAAQGAPVSDSAHWEALVARVEAEEPGHLSVVPQLELADTALADIKIGNDPEQDPSRWPWLSVAAAVAAAAIVAVLLVAPRGSETLDTADSLGQACETLPASRMLVTTAAGASVWVSSTARIADGEAFRTHDPVILDTTGLLEQPIDHSTLVSAPNVTTDLLPDLVDELTSARCSMLAGASMYLVTDGVEAARGAGCSLAEGGIGFWGVIVVDVDSPPVECAPTRTVLIGAGPGERSLWLAHHGCGAVSDSAGSCEDRLLTLDAGGPDDSVAVRRSVQRLWEDG